MARRNDGRVEPGQSLKTAFSARAWNRAQDAADVVLKTLGGVQGQEVPRQALPYTWVMAKNIGGSTIPSFSAALIYDYLTPVDPTDSANAADQFTRAPILSCAFAAGGYLNQTSLSTFSAPVWGVAVEPIKPEQIGRVAVSGVVQIKTRVVSHLHQYVTIADSSVDDQLTSCVVGEARIVWRAGGASFGGQLSDQWALVHLGNSHYTAEVDFSISSGSQWTKGTYKTVDLLGGDTVQAYNKSETLRGDPPGRTGTISFTRNRFVLIGADYWYEPRVLDGD